MPIVVGDFFERLRLVHSKIIDKNIYRRHSLDAFRAAASCCQIGRYAADFCITDFLANPSRRVINSVLSAASNNDRCSLTRESVGNGKADPSRRARDQSCLSNQLQIHGVSLLLFNHGVVTIMVLQSCYKRRC